MCETLGKRLLLGYINIVQRKNISKFINWSALFLFIDYIRYANMLFFSLLLHTSPYQATRRLLEDMLLSMRLCSFARISSYFYKQIIIVICLCTLYICACHVHVWLRKSNVVVVTLVCLLLYKTVIKGNTPRDRQSKTLACGSR